MRLVICICLFIQQDSIFVKFPDDVPMEEVFRASEVISDRITGVLAKPHVLEFEKVYAPFIQWAKKRYAGIKFDAGCPETGNLSFSGISAVRRDNFTYLTDCIKEALDKMLVARVPLEDLTAWCIERVDKLWRREVERDDFMAMSVTKSISKPLHEYGAGGSTTPAHVMAARRLAKQKDAAAIVAGTRFKTVMLQSFKGAKAGDKMEACAQAFLEKKPLDTAYYVEQLKKNLCQLVAPMYTGDELRRVVRTQPSLLSVFGAAAGSTVGPQQQIDRYKAGLEKKNKLIGEDEAERRIFNAAGKLKRKAVVLDDIGAEEAKEAVRGCLTTCAACMKTEYMGDLEDIACEAVECTQFYKRKNAFRRLHKVME